MRSWSAPPNRLEYELGFFVRGGDGLADVKPIAHLYKTQVYALAAHVGVSGCDPGGRAHDRHVQPRRRRRRSSTSGFPLALLDLLVYASTNGLPAGEVARELGLEADEVERVYRDLAAKRRVAGRNLAAAALVEHGELDELVPPGRRGDA